MLPNEGYVVKGVTKWRILIKGLPNWGYVVKGVTKWGIGSETLPFCEGIA